jgi:hypothetical protein
MNHSHNHDRDNRDDHDPANDNRHEDKAITPTPAQGGLVSLTTLAAALNSVDMTSGGSRSGKPMLLFKSREGSSDPWGFGQKRNIPEPNSSWAVNPMFMWGFICFGKDKQVLGERLVSVTQRKPDVTKLPDLGFPWQEEWAADMKCLDGADAGVEVIHKATTDGGIKAVKSLIEAVRDRINGGQHDDKIVPIVRLEKDSYQHVQYGRIWTPVLTIVDWMPLSGPTPAPAPTPPPSPTPASPTTEQQPRRRRVA